jgi:hypothetical protein
MMVECGKFEAMYEDASVNVATMEMDQSIAVKAKRLGGA